MKLKPLPLLLLLLLPALMVLVACRGASEPTLVAPTATPDVEATVEARLAEATATSMPIVGTGPSGLTITCTLDAEQLRISCQAHGYQEDSQLKWTSTASWADSGGAQWEFPIAKDLITPIAQVFLEECLASSCRTIEMSIDTSALVSKETIVPADTPSANHTFTATTSRTPVPSQTTSSSTPVPQPFLKLPFTTDDEPQWILPMGETILHEREAPWGHPGIDFQWDHKPQPLTAAAAGEVASIDINNNYGGFDISVFTGKFVVTYHVFELYVLNPNIAVGSQVTTGQAIGYPGDVSDEDDYHSTHWAFGTWEKLPEPITTHEGGVRNFITDYLCPFPYFTDSEQARLSRIWKEAQFPQDKRLLNAKEQFPDLCNGPYKNY